MAASLAPLTPYTSARHFFGAELRHQRLRARLSMNQLAQRILVSPDLLAKVERAQRFPSADLVTRCDHELDADGYLVRLHGLVVAERDTAKPHRDLAGLAASLHAALAPYIEPAAVTAPTSLVDRIDSLLAEADTAARRVPNTGRRR